MTPVDPRAQRRYRTLKLIGVIIGAILAAPVVIVLLYARAGAGDAR